MKTALLAAFLATTCLTLPAMADTFNMTISTTDRTNGYDIVLTGLSTDGSNIATSQVSGTVTGFGTDAFLTGSLGLVTPTSTAGIALEGNVFNFDGKAFASAPYFSNTSSSGIVEAVMIGADTYYLNPYNGGSTYYDSESKNYGSPTNPGDTVDISTTPLPAALPLMASGLGVLGMLGFRKKRKHS